MYRDERVVEVDDLAHEIGGDRLPMGLGPGLGPGLGLGIGLGLGEGLGLGLGLGLTVWVRFRAHQRGGGGEAREACVAQHGAARRALRRAARRAAAPLQLA